MKIDKSFYSSNLYFVYTKMTMFIILFVIIHTQLHIIRYTQGGSRIQHHETESENDKIEIEKREKIPK